MTDPWMIERPRPFTRPRLEMLLEMVQRRRLDLRHDIDTSPEAALALATWEATRPAGPIVATYYVWEESPYYPREQAWSLREMLAGLGHRVGRHVSEEHWGAFAVCTHPGNSWSPVSFHNPRAELLWRDWPGVTVASAPEWEGRYYSDSRGSFRFGDPEDHAGAWPIQVSLHPEWWMPALLGSDSPLAIDAVRRAQAMVAEATAAGR